MELAVCGNQFGDVAIFAVNATFAIQLRTDRGPNCRRRALLDRLEAHGNLADIGNREDTVHSMDAVRA